MDTATNISGAPTLTPGDSASQTANSPTAPPKPNGARPKRPAKAPVDKDAPQGAVQVPPGKKAPGAASKVTSATIPLSGWGNIDLSSHRRDIEPTFTVDARPYGDLVDTVYRVTQSRFSTGGKHIPRAVFRYYCLTLWWYRAIWLHRANGNALNSEQKNFLSILNNMEGLQIPTHIAQYLSNMGNFMQGGEQYYFRLAPDQFGNAGDGTVQKGWLSTSDPANLVTDTEFWTYSQIPVPGVMMTAMCNEANATFPLAGIGLSLDHIAPTNDGHPVHPSENIIGWDNTPLPPAHTSWRATYAQLGISATTLPPDLQTQFLVSTSVLKWMSDRLSTLKDFKLHEVKQITLSSQGHPMQAYYLATDVPASQVSQYPPIGDIANNHLCGSRFSDLSVKSRFAIDAKVLAPSFCFGYRLERSMEFRDYHNGAPRYWNTSNYQPWILLNSDGTARAGLSAAKRAGMNYTLTFGSLPFINVPRFSTHELNRSTGLDAALVLSDTK